MNYADFLARAYEARRTRDRQAALGWFRQAAEAHPGDIRAQAEMAADLRELGRFAEADAIYRAILAAQPDHLQATLGLGYCARFRGDHAAALEHFHAAAATHPNDIWPRMGIAVELRDLGRFEAAEAVYQTVLAEQPGQLQAMLGLGHCARRRGNRAAALERFKAAAEAHPNDIWPRIEMATELRDLDRCEEAEAVCQTVLAEQPGQLQAMLGIGHCARRRGDRAAALERFRAAAEAHPGDTATQTEIATDLRELGRFEEAEAVCRAVLAVQPTQYQAMLGLGYCARFRGDHAAALEHFRAAAEAHPNDIWPRMGMATELRDLGRFEAAEAVYQTVLAEQPGQLQAMLGLGHCARRRGNRAGALAQFRAAAQAHPNDVWPRIEMATELRDLDRLEEAEAGYRAVLAGQPGQLQAMLGLGHCARRRGDRATALERFRAAAEAHPGDAATQTEIATDLRELGRFEEAEAVYRAVLAAQPSHLQAMLGLGYCARFRGDRAAALAHFRAAAAAHPRDIWPRMGIAAELRDQADFAGAIAVCEAALAENPADLQAWLNLGQTHQQAGHLEAALDAFQRAVEHWPLLPHPRIEAARMQRLLGRSAASRKALHDLLEMLPEHADALQELGEQARLAHDLPAAEAFFRRALASQPLSTGAVFGLSQTLTELGRVEDGLELLASLSTRLNASPDVSARQVAILRQIGRSDQALRLACEASTRAPRHFWLWHQRVELDMLTGNHAAADEALHASPAGTAAERAVVSRLRGQLAELQWQFDAAIGHYRAAGASNPRDRAVCASLARVLMLSLDLPGAREQLQQVARLDRPAALLQGRSSNVSQTLPGQILDEYALDRATLEEMQDICKLPPDGRITPLLALVRRVPDHTPAAITWLIALRQANRLPATVPVAPAGSLRPIPRRVAQYWDSPRPPADLCGLMQSWRAMNPDFDYRVFDDQAAQAFLRLYRPEVLRAYQRAGETAQKADIFRLAWLFAQGGYYADADDRCLAPIDTVIPAWAALALYQEDYCTIGNNFIGAAPQHSVIGRALDLAVESVNRGDRDLIWFSTGPGLLTRAFAQVLANSSLDHSVWLDSLVMLGRAQINRAAWFHCMTSYKHTARHWNKATFSQSKGRKRTAPAVPAQHDNHP